MSSWSWWRAPSRSLSFSPKNVSCLSCLDRGPHIWPHLNFISRDFFSLRHFGHLFEIASFSDIFDRIDLTFFWSFKKWVNDQKKQLPENVTLFTADVSLAAAFSPRQLIRGHVVVLLRWSCIVSARDLLHRNWKFYLNGGQCSFQGVHMRSYHQTIYAVKYHFRELGTFKFRSKRSLKIFLAEAERFWAYRMAFWKLFEWHVCFVRILNKVWCLF